MAAALLWAMTAFAAAAAAVAAAAAEGREQIPPSLECSCRSSQRAGDRFNLQCHSAGNERLSPTGGTKHDFRVEHSTLSCSQGEAAADEAWWFAEVGARGAYRLSRRALGWRDAAAACEAEREQLVALDGGEAELKALLRAFADHTPDRKELFWVGVRYWESERDFYTVRGQKMSQLPWAANQPTVRKGENCVNVDGSGKIHATHECNNKLRFFCKL